MKKRKFKERIVAWLLAVIMVIGGCIIPDNHLVSYAAQTEKGTDQSGKDADQPTPGGDGGEATPTDYRVIITAAPKIYPEEQVQLTAVVQDHPSGTPVSDATVTWSLEGNPPATITPDGKLTVNKGTAANTAVTVKATYTNEQKEYFGTLDLTTSVRETKEVTFIVVDSYNNAPLYRAVVKLTQDTVPKNKNMAVEIGDDGRGLARYIYDGVEYNVSVNKEHYNAELLTGVTFDNVSEKTIELTTARTPVITVPEGPFYVGDTVNLSVEIPDEWRNETVIWKVNSDIGSISANGQLTSTSVGNVVVTATCHGVTSKEMTVQFRAVNEKTNVEVKAYSDELHMKEITAENKVYPNEMVYVKAEVREKVDENTNALPSNDGEMTFKVEKLTKDGQWKDVYNTGSTPINVNKADGLALWEIPADKLPTSGAYRITAEYKGNGTNWDRSEAASNQALFDITPKAGQGVNFVADLPAEYVYKTDVIEIEFEGSVATHDPNEYDITVESSGSVFNRVLLADNVQVSSSTDAAGLYAVRGTVNVELNNVGENAAITVRIKDHKDADQQVYADASATYTFNVTKKPLTISGIKFADKIYDGTPNVQLKSVSLAGIESIDSDEVWVDIGETQNDVGSKVFYLTGSDATEEGYTLDDPKFELAGKSAGKYTLDMEDYKDHKEDYKAEIQKCPIGIDPEALKLEQAYWSDLYTKNDSEAEDVYNTALNEAAYNARESLYTDIVETGQEKQKILDQLRDYHPKFKAKADKTSGLGFYDIYACNPDNENELKNYKFVFEGGKTKAGTLTIGAADVEANDFEVVGENVSKIANIPSFYVRSGSDADASVINCVNTDGSVKYNDVVFLDNLKNTKYFNPSKEGAVWPEENGEIAFKLQKKDEKGNVVAYSNPYVMKFICDDSVQSTITVTANNNNNGTFDEVIHTLTFGLFGNKGNTRATITYSDDLSGVKARYYAVVGYDAWQENGDYENALKNFTEWTSVEGDICIDFEDGRQIVLSKVVDHVGNIQYVTSNGIVVDSVEPNTITADIINKSDSGVYNRAVEIGVSVSDFIDDKKTYSGIASVDYKVEISHDDDNKEGWLTYIDKQNFYTGIIPLNIENAAQLKEQASYSGTITVSPEGQNYSTEPGVKNRMRVTIWATDYAGNVTEEKTVEFDFDTTAPKLEISFDGDAVNGKYFNKERTATVRVTEAYFDSSRVNCMADGAYDVQPGRPVGNNTYEAKYVYTTDGDWTFDISVTDKAGNKMTMADSFGGEDKIPANYKDFTIDKTAPEITDIRYYMYQGENVIEVTPGKAEAQRFYGNAKMYALVTLEEHNFDEADKTGSKESGLELDITAENKGVDYTEPAHAFSGHNKDTHTLRVDFNGDANYIFDMQYTDLAGNTLAKDYAAEYFTVDTQKPSASISVFGETWNKIIEVITFGLFSNENKTVEISNTSDQTAGVAEVQYYKSHDVMTAGQLDNAAWENGTTLELGPNQQAIVYGKITDKSGNYTYISTQGFVLDNMIDAPQIDIVTSKPLNNIYNDDVDAKIKVVDPDPTGKGDYAGLQSVYYEIRNNGTVTQSGNLNVQSGEARQQSVEDIIKINAQKNNSNNVQIYVKATDNAGNSAEETLDLKIDITKPDISVTFDNNAPLNQKYYKNTRTATIVVKERNFDPDNAQINITNTHGTKPQVTDWSSSANAGVSDEATHTAKIVFAADGDYKFTVDCTDLALNKAANPYTSEEFTIDKTAPEITDIRYYMYQGENTVEVTPGKAEAQRFYGNAKMYAILTLEEHNFDEADKTGSQKSGLELDITAENKGVNYTESAHAFSGHNKDTHTLRVDFNGDANYIFDMQYTDLAGNTLAKDYAAEYFTVDTQKPSANISVFGRTWDKIIEVITFGLFSNENKTVEISNAFDQTAGVAEIQYYKSHDVMTAGQLDKVAWENGTALTLGPNQQAVVYGKITDKSGNYTYISTNGFVLDNMIDAPQIDIVMPKPLHEIYNSDVDAKIKVVDPDPTGKGDYAGLQSVYYEIRNNGTVTQSGNLNVQAGEVRQQSVEDIIRINAQKNNSNNVQIYVKATDNAGNSAEETLDLKIDITKPDISVTFDHNAPLNQKYYKDTRTATIVVKERNFDPNNVQINITNTHGTKPQVTGWSSSANAGVSDEATHTARIVFATDGDYKFTVDCTDLALNKAANPYTSEEFTVDKTTPTINVSYDNNSALNGNFYKAGRTATIMIREHNFRAGDVKVTATAALGGKGVSAPSVSGWSSSGDNHTATVRFNSDADYTLDIAYADLAGNAAADYAQDQFTVDLTNPEIEITGVKNKSANNGTVMPEIKVTDTNFTASGVKLSLTGVNKGKLSADTMVTKAALGGGQVITFRNFGKDMDDIYTLTATATDKSGNETKKSIMFSVNRNGSTYVLSDDLKQLLETGFTNSPKDIVIEEINVDTLEFIELTYSKDGKVVKLKEGTDYTVKSEGGSNQWKKYIYTIKASCFEEEGSYAINIYSEDKAKNTSTNRIKEKTIEFIVDKTPPIMVISNIEDRGRYREDAHVFTLSVKDNTILSYVELYLDGKLVHTYKGDELIAEDGTISINVDSKGDYQTIRLIAYDEAGNPTEPMEYSVLVTSSWWIQFYMNKPLLIGSIVGLAAVIGLIIFVIVKRKKKNAQ